ncbi:YPDG domain-containing protein, partial [Corynebacterium guaraldiae]|uniref:YPDG domain-containing protein n=1 Tax=Corynebacterium guaraldiae TaxID=3051103 RepID=UPI0020940389
EVPVTVTYPDGTTDDAKAKFELDTDGDGTPDSKDDDDDNDGIPDKDEEEKGSNPKDKGSIPATPLEPGNPTDAATLEPSYEDQLVVPGKETKSTPSFTDKDGKDAKAPEGSKFKIADGFKAPEGYTVKIDETTGVITVTAPEKLNG